MRYLPMVERQADLYGSVPLAVAADGGYASQPNLEGAKALGVIDVAFQKKKGLIMLLLQSSASQARIGSRLILWPCLSR